MTRRRSWEISIQLKTAVFISWLYAILKRRSSTVADTVADAQFAPPQHRVKSASPTLFLKGATEKRL